MTTFPARHRSAASAMCGLLAWVAVGCTSAPSATSCRVDADCPAGDRCQSGSCQAGLQLEIVSPGEGTATRGTVQVQVQVTGGSAEVDLLLDGVQLVKLGAPYAYAWDTTTVAERSHELKARVVAGSTTYESLPRTVVVDRTAPGAPVVTAASPTNAQPVVVSGAAEAGATVRLAEGATGLGQVVAGGGGAWSVGVTLGEGSHAVVATAVDAAGNESAVSVPVTVVVDRTAPTVLARTPAPGVTNVWSRDAITVTFSEPMSTPGDQAVTLAGAGGTPIAKTLQPSPDRKTLTILPASLPPVPNTLTATLTAGLTDLAGNPLALPADAWTWDLPDWQDLGSVVSLSPKAHFTSLVVRVDAGSRPVVGWSSNGILGGIMRWSAASAWSALGSFPATMASSVDLAAAGSDVVWFAWSDGQAKAARWDGAAWGPTSLLSVDPLRTAGHLSLALDASQSPVAAWTERVGTFDQVFAKQWAGSSWVALGPGAISSATLDASSVSVSFDGSGRPVVSCVQTDPNTSSTTFGAWAWTGAVWTSSLSGIIQPALAQGDLRFASDGHAYVGGIDASVAPSQAKVSRYEYPVFGMVGSAALNVDPSQAATSASFAIDGLGQLLLAWVENDAGGAACYARRWNGSSWEHLGGNIVPLAPAPGAPAIGLGAGGLVAVAWVESEAPFRNHDLKVKRYNH